MSLPGICAFLLCVSVGYGQTTASFRAVVRDSSGGAVSGAAVTLSNVLTGFERRSVTDDDGAFAFSNIPLHTYTLLTAKDGFAPSSRPIALTSNIPQTLEIVLNVAGQSSAIEVQAYDRQMLVDPESTGSRFELNAATIERLPTPPGSRGLEAALLSVPGFAANANGAIHPRGAHNQMTYVIDGMPVSDQLTGAFANAVDPAIVQSIELFTGNVPAEFGNKLSGVAVITTRSGMGSGRKSTGSIQMTGGGFDTLGQITEASGGGDRWGYFALVNTMKSNRYLDQVSIDNLHNGGNSERSFARVDFQPGAQDQLRFSAVAGRSSFELANLRSQHTSGQDQRQSMRDAAVSIGWVHMVDPRTTFDATASYRTAIAQLFPSAGDTPVTAAQARHLSTVNLGSRWNRAAGNHTIRGGLDYQHFPVSENFEFGITDPSFNRPGSEGYIPTLTAHDLSRGGNLFVFSKRAAGNMYTGFIQDTIKKGLLTFTLGLRYDSYRFLVNGTQWQPRLGAAFHLPWTRTVFRASYNRTFQTPPNENLLLSNSDESSVLVPTDTREMLGGSLIRIKPERQDVYEAGVQQGIGKLLSFNGAVYHKSSRDMQDNDNFFNTGIIFPTSLSRSRTNGAEARLTIVPVQGFSGSVSATHYSTIVTPPFTGGLFLGSAAVDILNAGPFVIDHDQKLGLHGIAQYNLKRNVWLSGSVRRDSGLVSNPSDPAVVAADPDYADLLPFVNLASDPPRVNARTIADAAIGFQGYREDRRAWEAVFQISNLTNRTALYNFQSIFVGTRLVQPRTAAVRIRLFW